MSRDDYVKKIHRYYGKRKGRMYCSKHHLTERLMTFYDAFGPQSSLSLEPVWKDEYGVFA